MVVVGAEAVKSARRVLDILELLTGRESPMTFTEISEALRLPRSSLHSLLWTLTDAGWLELHESTRRYGLGLRTLEAGHAYGRSLDLPERAHPYLERVSVELDETVQLSVLDGRFNVYVGKVEGTQPLRLASEVGRRLPAHATGLGKVLLTALSTQEFDAVFSGVRLESFTPRTIGSRRALRAAVEQARVDGFAADDEEYTPGVRCVAVGVRDHTGAVVAAMSVSVPSVRFGERRQQEALRQLRVAAEGLSTALGHRPLDAVPAGRSATRTAPPRRTDS